MSRGNFAAGSRNGGNFGRSQNSFVARHGNVGSFNHASSASAGRQFAGPSNSFVSRHSAGYGNRAGNFNQFSRNASLTNNRNFNNGFGNLNRGYGGYGRYGAGYRGYGPYGSGYGLGYGRYGLGYGGYGRYGWGRSWWWPFFGYYPFLGYGMGYGLGYGLGYGGYGYGNYYGGYGGYGGYGNYASYPAYTTDQATLATTTPDPAEAATYTERGEVAFKAGNYSEAVYDWRHALVDDPQNGTLGMLYAQALFASGSYEESAGATQMAMAMMPPEEWGVVVKNYTELYPRVQNYTEQLRGLEKARNDKPEEPALRFLLGFHYNYLGYPQQATRELDKTIQLAPQDEFAKQLLAMVKGTASPSGSAPPAASPAPTF